MHFGTKTLCHLGLFACSPKWMRTWTLDADLFILLWVSAYTQSFTFIVTYDLHIQSVQSQEDLHPTDPRSYGSVGLPLTFYYRTNSVAHLLIQR